MKIKLLFLSILAISILCMAGFTQASDHPGKEKKFPSVYKEGIVINGSSSEWENSLFSFNKKAQVNYAIVNDSAAFYICIRIADEGAQMKVLKSGIDLRFNTKGKKKAEANLHYPMGVRTEMGGGTNPGSRRDRKTMQLMFLLQMQDMELSGFRKDANGFQNIKSGRNGVFASVNWDTTSVMVYEARVPFSIFTTDVHAANPLAVGIIIKGAVKPKESHNEGVSEPAEGGMQGGGQGGMRPGSGLGNAGQMHGYNDNQKIFEDDEIWQSIGIDKKE